MAAAALTQATTTQGRTPALVFAAALLVAGAGGALWGLCFQVSPWLVLPWVALVPLVLLVGVARTRRWSTGRVFLLGWLHGTVAWAVAIPWIPRVLNEYGQLPPVLAGLIFLLLALYLGAYDGLLLVLVCRWPRLPEGCLPLAVACLWVLLEVLRTYLLSGFPWNLAAYSVIAVPGALALSAWVGPYGVSFFVVLMNAALAMAIGSRRIRWLGALPLAAVVLSVAAWANQRALVSDMGEASSGSAQESVGAPISFRLVQPNIGMANERDSVRENQAYAGLIALSPCRREGELIVWPESATWPYEFTFHQRLRRDVASLTEEGCGVLLNSAVEEDGSYFNATMLVLPDGQVARYDKRHLVPFGEYVPLAGFLPFVRQLARNAGAFSPGVGDGLLTWGRTKLGVALCFEIVFPAEVAARVRRGAGVLLTMTNDSWYGDTTAPRQHLVAARYRAAENRRPLLRAAITGISAVIAADGSVRQSIGLGERGTLDGQVEPIFEMTIYTRYPWVTPAVSGALLLGLVWSSRRRGTP